MRDMDRKQRRGRKRNTEERFDNNKTNGAKKRHDLLPATEENMISQPNKTSAHGTGLTFNGGGDKTVNMSNCTFNVKAVHGESSTSSPLRSRQSTDVEAGRVEEGGYIRICDDTVMYDKEPIKCRSNVYSGYQEHVSENGTPNRVPVAIKRIIPSTERHKREVDHLVALAPHPNVVRIIRSKEHKGQFNSVLFIVMELCSRQNLQDYLNENRENNTPFDFKKTMKFTKQLLKGMKHIHDNSIVHRDVKPENVLLSTDKTQLKFADFGLGKELRQGHTSTKVTVQGQGTEGYRAPETFSSEKVSKSADIFSLGITLFCLWTNGKHPFGGDIHLRDHNIKTNKNRDFSGLLITGTQMNDFIDLISRMLQHDPKQRPDIDRVLKQSFFKNTTGKIRMEQEHPTTSGFIQPQEVRPSQDPLEEIFSKEAGPASLFSENSAAPMFSHSDGQPTDSFRHPAIPFGSAHQSTAPIIGQSPTPITSYPSMRPPFQYPTTLTNQSATSCFGDSPMPVTPSGTHGTFLNISPGYIWGQRPPLITDPSGLVSFQSPVSIDRAGMMTEHRSELLEYNRIHHQYAIAEENLAIMSQTLAGDNAQCDLEEKGVGLMKNSKFSEAISLLQDLPITLRQQMILAECYFQICSDEKAKKCIGNMKTTVVRQPRPKAVDVYNLGMANSEMSLIKAMTFFACAAKIYLLESNADVSVHGIADCSYQCSFVLRAMIEQNERMRILARDVGMEIMNGFVDDGTSVENSDPDVKADMVARCLDNTGFCYNDLKNYHRAIECYKRGMDIMNRQFGENSSKYSVFGALLRNMGEANENLRNYSEAETLYKRSVDAYKGAEDWLNDEQKKENIEATENSLRITHSKMKSD